MIPFNKNYICYNSNDNKIGYWFNEPLYVVSKKLDGSEFVGHDISFSTGFGPYLKSIIKYEAYAVHKTSYTSYTLPYVEGSWYTRINYINGNNIYFLNNTAWENYYIYVDIYYTRT